jgi:hypothetical protein
MRPVVDVRCQSSTMKYEVEHTEHGIVVRGPVPVPDLIGLTRIAEERGWDLVDAELSGHLGVTMVLTDAHRAKDWKVELGLIEDDGERPCPDCGKSTRWDEYSEYVCYECFNGG